MTSGLSGCGRERSRVTRLSSWATVMISFSLGLLLRFGLLRGQFAVLHALELQSVGIEEEHGVVVLVVLIRRIDNPDFLLLEEVLQRIDVLPVSQFEGIVV